MIKFLLFTIMIGDLLSCNKLISTTIGFSLEKVFTLQEVKIITEDSVYIVRPDSLGNAQIMMNEKQKAGYAVISCGHFQVPVYIEPGKGFDISFRLENGQVIQSFTGEGALKNIFLNNKKYTEPIMDFTQDESQFIETLEVLEQSLVSELDSLGFDPEFSNSAKKKLHYIIYSNLGFYPFRHASQLNITNYKPSEDYYIAINNAIWEDEELMDMLEYRQCLFSQVTANARKNMEIYDDVLELENKLTYIRDSIKSPVIAEFLVHSIATSYVDNFGVDNLGVISPVYDAKVTDAKKRTEFSNICECWAKVAKGQPAPMFRYIDIYGKEISLTDIVGKYVYIDIWATWCAPCREEIPALKELEHKFEKNNIYFVSISCDQDKTAWEKMVKDDKLGGIQLHYGGDSRFMKTFMALRIPRFILLDRDGKIVAANMYCPSDPRTAEFLAGLEGI